MAGNGVQANYVWNADSNTKPGEQSRGHANINHVYSYDAHGNRASQTETINASTKIGRINTTHKTASPKPATARRLTGPGTSLGIEEAKP